MDASRYRNTRHGKSDTEKSAKEKQADSYAPKRQADLILKRIDENFTNFQNGKPIRKFTPKGKLHTESATVYSIVRMQEEMDACQHSAIKDKLRARIAPLLSKVGSDPERLRSLLDKLLSIHLPEHQSYTEESDDDEPNPTRRRLKRSSTHSFKPEEDDGEEASIGKKRKSTSTQSPQPEEDGENASTKPIFTRSDTSTMLNTCGQGYDEEFDNMEFKKEEQSDESSCTSSARSHELVEIPQPNNTALYEDADSPVSKRERFNKPSTERNNADTVGTGPGNAATDDIDQATVATEAEQIAARPTIRYPNRMAGILSMLNPAAPKPSYHSFKERWTLANAEKKLAQQKLQQQAEAFTRKKEKVAFNFISTFELNPDGVVEYATEGSARDDVDTKCRDQATQTVLSSSPWVQAARNKNIGIWAKAWKANNIHNFPELLATDAANAEIHHQVARYRFTKLTKIHKLKALIEEAESELAAGLTFD